jgi:hypothetical protein
MLTLIIACLALVATGSLTTLNVGRAVIGWRHRPVDLWRHHRPLRGTMAPAPNSSAGVPRHPGVAVRGAVIVLDLHGF